MLLNEFLKEHRKVEEQDATIAALKAGDAQQTKAIAELKELVIEQAEQIREVKAPLKTRGLARLMANDE